MQKTYSFNIGLYKPASLAAFNSSSGITRNTKGMLHSETELAIHSKLCNICWSYKLMCHHFTYLSDKNKSTYYKKIAYWGKKRELYSLYSHTCYFSTQVQLFLLSEKKNKKNKNTFKNSNNFISKPNVRANFWFSISVLVFLFLISK